MINSSIVWFLLNHTFKYNIAYSWELRECVVCYVESLDVENIDDCLQIIYPLSYLFFYLSDKYGEEEWVMCIFDLVSFCISCIVVYIPR